MHQADSVIVADHPGETGGGIFSHAVADQRAGLDTHGHPQLRQGVLDDEYRRQLHGGFMQFSGGRLQVGFVGEKQRFQVDIRAFGQGAQTGIEVLAENRFLLV